MHPQQQSQSNENYSLSSGMVASISLNPFLMLPLMTLTNTNAQIQ
jgi:hypothetical protein